VSRERVLEMTAEGQSLIEKQEKALSTRAAFFDLSVEELTAYVQRHARIEQLSKELKELSYRRFCATSQRPESIN
jgi:hypothetical protein